MTPAFSPLTHEPRLSDRVAEALRERIASGALAIADKLPSEKKMASEFGVSRTVVREAISRMKSEGLLYTRQGKGIYVAPTALIRPLRIAPEAARSLRSVLDIVELRRALEGEAAALAAERRTKSDVTALRAALRAMDVSLRAGSDCVVEDVEFHRLIAEASGNSYYLDVLEYIGQFLLGVTTVIWAEVATRADHVRQVRSEHHAILEAIVAQDANAARHAGSQHMQNTAGRIQQADPEFWRDQGPFLSVALRPHAPGDSGPRNRQT